MLVSAPRRSGPVGLKIFLSPDTCRIYYFHCTSLRISTKHGLFTRRRKHAEGRFCVEFAQRPYDIAMYAGEIRVVKSEPLPDEDKPTPHGASPYRLPELPAPVFSPLCAVFRASTPISPIYIFPIAQRVSPEGPSSSPTQEQAPIQQSYQSLGRTSDMVTPGSRPRAFDGCGLPPDVSLCRQALAGQAPFHDGWRWLRFRRA